MGLLTNDGRVKPAGRVFKQLADSYRGKPVVFPTATLAATAQPEDARRYVAMDSGLAGMEREDVGEGAGSEFCGKTSVLQSGFLA